MSGRGMMESDTTALWAASHQKAQNIFGLGEQMSNNQHAISISLAGLSVIEEVLIGNRRMGKWMD